MEIFDRQEALVRENLLVTIAIPVLNEENFILNCIETIRNSLDSDSFEIIIADGGSTDRTLDILKDLAKADPAIRILDNPKRYQSAGVNLALNEARGTFFVRLDAHSKYPPDYVKNLIAGLQSELNFGNYGGVAIPRGTNKFSRLVALALTSSVGAGISKFRRKGTFQGPVDTVPFGSFRTEFLRSINGFDERWQVNEDYELNIRIRETGSQVFLNSSIEIDYFCRDSLRKLIRQYLKYGFWRAKTIANYPSQTRLKYLLPLGLIGMPSILLLSHVKFGASIAFFWSFWLLYVFLVFLGMRAKSNRFNDQLMLIGISFSMHLTFSIGLLCGLVWWGFNDRLFLNSRKNS